MSLIQVRRWLRDAESVAVLTGAGMSAESGIPTFRGQGGLWRHYRAEELATAQAFASSPNLVWEWYNWRRELMIKAEPHAGHVALAALEARVPDFTLVTQNVDGLDERAGIRKVIRLHGDIWRTVCTRCGDARENREVPLSSLPPHCFCSPDALLRPAVVWFGESLPREAWLAAEEVMTKVELLLVVGTSAVVYPASGLVPLAIRSGAQTVEINPQPTALSNEVDIRLAGSAAELLPKIVDVLHAEV